MASEESSAEVETPELARPLSEQKPAAAKRAAANKRASAPTPAPDDVPDDDSDDDAAPKPMTLYEALNKIPAIVNFMVDDKTPLGDSVRMLFTLIGRTGNDFKTGERGLNRRIGEYLLERLDRPLPDGVVPYTGGSAIGADQFAPPGTKDEIEFAKIAGGAMVIRAVPRDPAKRIPKFQASSPDSPTPISVVSGPS